MRRTGKRAGAVMLGFVLMPSLVLAQNTPASTESVTVTGTKSREVIHNFVQSLAAPTHYIGKLARWDDGICPVAAGLRRQFTDYITSRIRTVAAQVGAPVSKDKSCKPNIEIVFTRTPQELVDNIRKKNEGYLGYYDNEDQLNRLAKVTRPIQAWYMTATRDLTGNLQVDSAKVVGIGLPVPCSLCPSGIAYLPYAKGFRVTGSRLGDSLHSALYHVTIVADPRKIVDEEIGTVTDYIAMLALTQPGTQDTCQPLPSILNLLAGNCGTKSNALTENDRAFLHGLYKMSPDRALDTQKDEISYQMEQELKGR